MTTREKESSSSSSASRRLPPGRARLQQLVETWRATAVRLRTRCLVPRNEAEGIADAARAWGLATCANDLAALLAEPPAEEPAP